MFDLKTLTEGSVLLFDKPQGWSSFDLVNKLGWAFKRKFKQRIKVGHAGTLDPQATGLLIICTGKATKRITEFQDLPKTYIGQMEMGAITPSYDMETPVSERFDISNLTDIDITQAALTMVGAQMQMPPAFSALKIDGERAYDIARRGEKPAIVARPVVVYSYNITHVALPLVDFEIVCSKGTYIRSLIHDLGNNLGNGAYMTQLRRTAIGDYKVDDAMDIIKLKEYFS